MRDIWNGGLNWNEQVWRYLSAKRIAAVLDRRRLYFAAATQFADRFEGAVAVMPPDFPTDIRYEDADSTEKAFRELKRLTKISCWHCADFESDAMWKLYAGASKGVAICSTPERMRAAFVPFRIEPDYGIEELWCGPVRYGDLLQVRINAASMLERFFYKHRAFEWEREFRLAISVRQAEEFGVRVPEFGIKVSIDLGAFVERIVLGPALSSAERDLIIDHARTAGLGDRLTLSSLLGRPRYV